MVTAMSFSARTSNGRKARARGSRARDGDRIYGRGTADNKVQHTINMAALKATLR